MIALHRHIGLREGHMEEEGGHRETTAPVLSAERLTLIAQAHIPTVTNTLIQTTDVGGETLKCAMMSTHASVLVDSVGPPSAEVCRTAASFP
jgi:hypothetical protein